MSRITVVRTSRPPSISPVIVNDEIGLDHFVDYTLSQHLEDLASEGLTVLALAGDSHFFSDGSVRILSERHQAIDESKLDPETAQMLAAAHTVAA